jgi:hypothetical protein
VADIDDPENPDKTAPEWFFGDTKIGRLRRRVLELLQEHERDGALPTSVRFLFYEAVQRRIISKTRTGARRADQDLIDAAFSLREQGIVPWDWIIDETRELSNYTGWETIEEGVRSYLGRIPLDPWNGEAPLVLTESRSLAGVLQDVASDYRIIIAATNGQCGGFLRTDIVPILRHKHRLLYLGDLDLSGGIIEANTRRVLERERRLRWERLALTDKQADEFNLRHLAITKIDKRFHDGEHEAIETEALGQSVIVDILRARLDDLLPEQLAAVQEREQRERRRIERLLNGGDVA